LPGTWTAWFAKQVRRRRHAQAVCNLAERMTMWPVDKRVGNVKNNDPSLIAPISIA
jgi:putative SOS response-associated peptidase YedK